jgi:hypothetical protein
MADDRSLANNYQVLEELGSKFPLLTLSERSVALG